MKIVLIVIAIVVVLIGGVWFLQGINVLPGSIMSGHLQWVIIGGIAVIVGLGVLVFGLTRKAGKARK